jgi:glucosamine--fructose-6-phosphate aminotransferase (isomerizing)
MSKEIREQPAVLRRIVTDCRREIESLAAVIQAADRIVLLGCGTAGNAAMAGTYLFSELAARDTLMIPASEIRHRRAALGSSALVIALSQSGETIDVLEAMYIARDRSTQLAAILNAAGSTLDRLVETRVHLRAGVEQCVLATKSYTAMVATLLLTSHLLADRWSDGVQAVQRAADVIDHMLSATVVAQIQDCARQISAGDHLFVIGRGIHYASALEAALKIKEVSYIHAEGFAGGELKHGVIALIEPGTACLVFAPNDETRTDVVSGAAELRSRGAHVIGVGSENDPVFDTFIYTPHAGIASPIAQAAVGQLLGYHVAIERGHDPDRPRNLAKSVTVK